MSKLAVILSELNEKLDRNKLSLLHAFKFIKMEWINYPENKPEESGTYLVSITRPYSNGDYTFKYVAFFNVENNQWFKYDSFADENEVLERITFRVNGWVEKLPIYLR